MTPRARSHAAWLVAALGAALTLCVFYPGFMSADSAEQWLQARTGRYTSTHPPLMALVWSLTHSLVPGPGGLFVLHVVLFWFAIGWLARELFAHSWPQIAFVFVLGLWPPILGISTHLWKDVPMAAFAMLGAAVLIREQRQPAKRWLIAAVACFILACAYRHNALPLVIPFLAVIVARWGIAGRWQRIGTTVLLSIAVALIAALPARHPAVIQRDVWPVTAVWDLAAVSIVRNEMLIPADWRAPDLDVDALRAVFQPWSNTTIFDTRKLRVSLYSNLTRSQRDSLYRAWLDLWLRSPLDIVHHRLRLTALLFGLRRDEIPPGLDLWLQMSPLAENPPIEVTPSAVRDAAVAALQASTRTPLFVGWIYLCVIGICAITAWRRPQQPLFWPCIASVVLYCAPLVVFAPSAEFRYLLWPVIATFIVLALRLNPQASVAQTGAADNEPDRRTT